jgi:hypothetical protein
MAVDHPQVGHDAPVGVVDGVEDQRAGGRLGVADGRRDRLDHVVEQLAHAHAGLARHPQHVGRVTADQAGQLLGELLRLRRGQVDLVEHRDDVQVVVHRQVEVGQRLRLDALGGVDQQDRALARLQRPGHLVGEVDVAGGVDHVEHVPVPGQPHGLRLDRDAALALDVHPVEILSAHGAVVHHTGDLQHPVGKGRLAVVDVRDDAEVADQRGVGLARLSAHRSPFRQG